MRRWEIDPKSTAFESPYATFGNNPIWKIDIQGDSAGPVPQSLASKKYTPSGINFLFIYLDPTKPGSTVEHSHVDDIKNIYEMTGGDKTFNKQAGAINEMNSNLQPVRIGSIVLPVGTPSITNLNTAFYSVNESGSEKAWANLLLGGMIRGTVPENIVFSENGTVSNYLIGSPVVNGILDQWNGLGRPINDKSAYGFNYDAASQITDVISNLSFISMSNFAGSASATVIANPNANTITLTITNVTSVHSGDYQKHMYWHNDDSPFLLRDPNNSNPQPYTNFSQTFQLKVSYNDAVRGINARQTLRDARHK